MHLGADDTRKALTAAGQLAANPPCDFAAVCELLRQLIPSQSASFNDMALGSGDFRYVIVPPGDEELAAELKPAYDRYFHQHPLIAQAQIEPQDGSLRFCDVPDGDRFTETDLFKKFYRPFGLRYQLVIQLPSPPSVVVGYALNRTDGQGEFSDRDVAVLNALAGHLAMHHRVTNDLQRSLAISEEVGQEGWSVVSIRSDGVVEGSSSTTMIPGLSEGDAVPPGIAALLPTHDDPKRGMGSHDVHIGNKRWRCVVHPVPIGPTVLLMRHLADESSDLTLLIDRGLTPRQADVALALARSGDPNSHLARSLDMSEGTVKKHLEAVFRVLGVDSRAAAAVAAGDLIRDRPDRSDQLGSRASKQGASRHS